MVHISEAAFQSRSFNRCARPNREFWKVQKMSNPHLKAFMEVTGRILSFLLPTNGPLHHRLIYRLFYMINGFIVQFHPLYYHITDGPRVQPKLMDKSQPEVKSHHCEHWGGFHRDVLVVVGSYLCGGQAAQSWFLFLPASHVISVHCCKLKVFSDWSCVRKISHSCQSCCRAVGCNSPVTDTERTMWLTPCR